MQSKRKVFERGLIMATICLILTFVLSLLCSASTDSLDPTCMLKEFTPTDERIRAQGYPAESHFVETEDGYILNLFRIPYSYKLQNQHIQRPVILLQHGLLSNSDCWLSTGRDYALAYLLADVGFDVWLGNARGNIYSRYNTRISTNSPSFWRFDWHEIGTIDIPKMINFIVHFTGEQRIHYVGYSQGTTAYFVMLSQQPEYNKRIKSAHMLAPCAFLGDGKSYIFKVLKPLIGKPGGLWNHLLSNMEMMPQNALFASISNTGCGTDPSLEIICKNLWILFAGESYTNTNLTALQVLLETHPGGGSTNQAIHYIQLSDHNKGRFCQMDYGEQRNKEIYGQQSPSDYNMRNIKAPTYLYSGANDGLCGPEDVDALVAAAPYLAGDIRIQLESFNHLDFIISHNMKELLNDRVIENILKHENSF